MSSFSLKCWKSINGIFYFLKKPIRMMVVWVQMATTSIMTTRTTTTWSFWMTTTPGTTWRIRLRWLCIARSMPGRWVWTRWGPKHFKELGKTSMDRWAAVDRATLTCMTTIRDTIIRQGQRRAIKCSSVLMITHTIWMIPMTMIDLNDLCWYLLHVYFIWFSSLRIWLCTEFWGWIIFGGDLSRF